MVAKPKLTRRERDRKIKQIYREMEAKKRELGLRAPVLKKGPVFYLVVLVVLMLLGGALIQMSGKADAIGLGGRKLRDGRPVMAQKSVDAVAEALGRFRFHTGVYPSVAEGGIDDGLFLGLGGKKCRFLNGLDDKAHYGREFTVDKTLAEFKKHINKEFGTQKTLVYGSLKRKAGLVASFCGGGAEYALSYVRGGGKADTVITSDMPHHVLKELTERGKQVIILTHYASENYGFKRFFERVKGQVFGKAETFYFEDKRFL